MDQYPISGIPEENGAPFLAPQEPKPPRRLGKDKLQVGIPLVALAFYFIFASLVAGIIYAVAYLFIPALCEEMWFQMAISAVAMYVIALPIAALIFHAVPAQAPKKENMELHVFLGFVGICFGLTFIGGQIGNMLNQTIGAITGEVPENDLAETVMQMPMWANFLFTAICAPIFEEILCRKLMIDRLTKYGDLPALLISGISFGLIHGNFYQFFYAAAVGLLFGYVYLKTGKLRYTIAMHMILNFVGSVYTAEMLKLSEGLLAPISTLMAFAYIVFMGAAIIGGIVALILLWKKISFARAEDALTGKQWAKVLLLNPASWIFAAAMVFMFWSALA